MGKSYYSFLIRSQEDLAAVRELEKKHNEAKEGEAGEEFDSDSEYMIKFEGEYFLILTNGGGCEMSMKFLRETKPKLMVIFWPFNTPQGWFDVDTKFLYKKGKQMNKVLKKLPEKTPETECKFKPNNKPVRTPRDDIYDMLKAAFRNMTIMRNVKI